MTKIGFYNNKGGVGKTTTAINAAFILAQTGKSVLAVDCDDQRNLLGFFADGRYESKVTAKHYSVNLSEIYDIAIYDLPPAMNDFTREVLSECDVVFAPLDCSKFAVAGLGNLINEIVLSGTRLGGIFVTMYNKKSVADNAALESLRENFSDKLMNSIIPYSGVIKSSMLGGVTAFEYMKWTSAALAFGDLTAEILEVISDFEPEIRIERSAA